MQDEDHLSARCGAAVRTHPSRQTLLASGGRSIVCTVGLSSERLSVARATSVLCSRRWSGCTFPSERFAMTGTSTSLSGQHSHMSKPMPPKACENPHQMFSPGVTDGLCESQPAAHSAGDASEATRPTVALSRHHHRRDQSSYFRGWRGHASGPVSLDQRPDADGRD